MTLRLRNTSMLLLSVLITLMTISFIILFVRSAGNVESINLQQFISVLATMVFATAACFVIFISFRNTASAEIFFFFLFLCSFCFDMFKEGLIIINDISLPFSYSMFMTRVVYFGRFFGVVALFCSGLFSTGLEYQRMSMMFLISVIIAVGLVSLLPVDLSRNIPGGTRELGSFLEIYIILILLQLISVVNFIIASNKNENTDYLFLAGSLILTVAGRELLFLMPGIAAASAGFVLLVSGTVVFGLKTHRIYLWE